MRYKRDITARIKRVYLLLQSQRFVIYGLLFVVNFLIPTLNLMTFLSNGTMSELNISIRRCFQLFLPFTSSLWFLFPFRCLVDEKGAEILFLNKDKTKLLDALLIFTMMMVNISAMSFIYSFFVNGMAYLWLRIILICIFYFGASYFLIFLTGSVTPALLFLIVYTLLNLIEPFNETLFPFYYSPEAPPSIVACEIQLAFTGVILILAGTYIAKRKRCFSH